MKVKVKKVTQTQEKILPTYATNGSAGMDLYAAITNPILIGCNKIVLIPTGIALALPRGYEAQIRSRSGLAVKFGVIVLNSPGTIDSDYRGEIKVLMINLGLEPFQVTPHMRIAQMVIAKYENISWQLVDELENTERGSDGFGSTGYK